VLRYSYIMNSHKVTPKDFFLWAGAMVALYGSVISFITLLFAYINHAYPDALEAGYYYNYDPFSASIRFAMASLIVLVPLAIVLLQMIRRDIVRDHSRADLWVRRWALFLTLFITGAAMAIDLITLVNYFLGGEITTRFVLKVLVVLLTAAAIFMHFLADLWGFWIKFPGRARMVGIAAGVLVIATIVSGFFIIGSPNDIRMQRLDSQKISDLQGIQNQITYYYQTKGKLPENLSQLQDPLVGYVIPKDAQTGQDYGYRITTPPYSFEVCATFNRDSTGTSDRMQPSMAMHIGVKDGDNWVHTAGQTCFERTIDPDMYPPFTKGR
jgi:hypothetical protein